MSRRHIVPTDIERTFGQDELIVSKTDTTGRITYVNELFIEISGYARHELIGTAHSVIRHPAMPRGVFKLLWDTIQSGSEVFAYVKNMTKSGDHYWVLAHVTPTFDDSGKIISYHSNRRSPDRDAIAAVEPLYALMLAEEAKCARGDAAEASFKLLASELAKRSTSYEKLVFAITGTT